MTDSIYRLYTAVFLREPDQAGFEGWIDNYARRYWDIFIDNLSGEDIELEASFIDEVGTVLYTSDVFPLPAGAYVYQWNIDPIDRDPSLDGMVYGIRFEILGGQNEVYVIAVGTDRLMPPDRPPWVGVNNRTAASLVFAD